MYHIEPHNPFKLFLQSLLKSRKRKNSDKTKVGGSGAKKQKGDNDSSTPLFGHLNPSSVLDVVDENLEPNVQVAEDEEASPDHNTTSFVSNASPAPIAGETLQFDLVSRTKCLEE